MGYGMCTNLKNVQKKAIFRGALFYSSILSTWGENVQINIQIIRVTEMFQEIFNLIFKLIQNDNVWTISVPLAAKEKYHQVQSNTSN